SNPMGVAIFANAIDYLQKLDLEFDSYSNEFTLGRKRIYVAPEMLTDKNGSMVFDPDDTVFYQLPEDYSQQLQKDPIKESNMQLRVEEHSKAINDDLNYLSMRCGFGTERYKFDNGNITTATQVISENSDMFRTIKKHELILDAALKQLVRIIIRLGNVLGAGLPEDTEITIDFDDSIIEDKTAERQSDRQEVSMGVMSRAEYRAKWYGEALEQAQRSLPEQESGVLE
ncbi:MAG TPA: phage portal protein, partial [Methanocorpusculum sp.]|nr:phage portal protein [Methanocorpusculum sp.]